MKKEAGAIFQREGRVSQERIKGGLKSLREVRKWERFEKKQREQKKKKRKKKEKRGGSGLLGKRDFFFLITGLRKASRIILELPEVAATPASEHIHRPHHLQHNLGEIHVFKRRTISRLHRSPRKGEESSPSCTFGIGRSTIIISEKGTHAPDS